MSRHLNSPLWRLSQAHGLLILSGGSDETYVVDEAQGEGVVERLLAAWKDDDLDSLLNDPACGAAVRQLRRVGALVPCEAIQPVYRHAVQWLGDELVWLRESLATGAVSLDANPDIVLVVRTNAEWRQALVAYTQAPPARPHLLIDLAYHHTLSIGPFVVPGDTACIACLGHRLAHRWGDLPPPPRPAVQQHEGLISSLVRLAIDPVVGEDTRLARIESAVSLNLRTFASTEDPVYRQPWCPVCYGGNGGAEAAIALALPWLTAI